MKLKELESLLQDVSDFDNPKRSLEQYMTPAHIAARMLYTMDIRFKDIEDKFVIDLGCGSGILTVGALFLGAGSCLSIDIDSEAVTRTNSNCRQFELNNFEIIQGDVMIESDFLKPKCCDTVFMNPPFGTKNNSGIDMIFVQKALALATGAVYSLHKSSTRDHIIRKAQQWGVNLEVVAELNYNLQATYASHKEESKDIAVDFIRFSFPVKKRSLKLKKK